MDPEKLLIFRIGHLGDTLVSLPALWAIRKVFPKAHIALLSNADKKNPHYISPDQVLPKNGLIDEWITYPTNLGKASSVSAMLNLLGELKRQKFNTLFYMMPRIRTNRQIDRDLRFFRFAGISKFVGVDHLRQTQLSLPIPTPTPFVEAEWRHLLKCLSSDDIIFDESDLKPDLLLSKAEIASARTWFKNAAGTDADGLKLVAVAPGSKWESKIWPEERFAAVITKLVGDHLIFPVVFGGNEDREKGDRLIAEWGIGANSAGILSLRESAALLAECKLYLGNDTGSMHLAASVGVPCVAIFASIDWKGRWLPFGDKNKIFRQTVECEGCHTPDCFNNHKCLTLTGTDEVYEACSQMLTS